MGCLFIALNIGCRCFDNLLIIRAGIAVFGYIAIFDNLCIIAGCAAFTGGLAEQRTAFRKQFIIWTTITFLHCAGTDAFQRCF